MNVLSRHLSLSFLSHRCNALGFPFCYFFCVATLHHFYLGNRCFSNSICWVFITLSYTQYAIMLLFFLFHSYRSFIHLFFLVILIILRFQLVVCWRLLPLPSCAFSSSCVASVLVLKTWLRYKYFVYISQNVYVCEKWCLMRIRRV